MPFDGSGNFTPSSAPNFPAVGGTVINPTYYNTVVNDIASGLSNCLTRDGQGKPSANINWNAKNLTNVQVLQLNTALDVAYGGTALTSAPTNGQLLIGNGTNYTLATLTAGSGMTITNGVGAITITFSGGSALTGALTTATPAAGQEALIIPHGVAPTVPTNGSIWTTTLGMYVRTNGATVGPLVGVQGATFTGKITTIASASGGAGLNLPHGTAPSAPVNGDLWTTSSNLFCRINGATASFITSLGGTLTGAVVLAANSTLLTPIAFQSGSLNTTPVAGGLEYNGTNFFAAKDANTRQIIETAQVSFGTAATALTSSFINLLDAGSNTFNAEIGLYEIEVFAIGSNGSGNNDGIQLQFSRTATGGLSAIAVAGPTNVAGAVTQLAAITQTVVAANSTVSSLIHLKGIFSCNGAGNIIPQIATTNNTAGWTKGYGSYMKMTRLSGVSTAAAVGYWS